MAYNSAAKGLFKIWSKDANRYINPSKFKTNTYYSSIAGAKSSLRNSKFHRYNADEYEIHEFKIQKVGSYHL